VIVRTLPVDTMGMSASDVKNIALHPKVVRVRNKILDEILKGTNSKDKQTGSKALIEQLINMNATGIIATHDLALGQLIESYPNNITNKRFEVEIENNQLIFDYKIKDGISQNLNATFLMKKMGITV